VQKSCLWDSSENDKDGYFEAIYAVVMYRNPNETTPSEADRLTRKTLRIYDSKEIGRNRAISVNS